MVDAVEIMAGALKQLRPGGRTRCAGVEAVPGVSLTVVAPPPPVAYHRFLCRRWPYRRRSWWAQGIRESVRIGVRSIA